MRLTVRLDIEDRNFHSQTKRNSGAEHHFTANTHPLKSQPGFAFTPARDRHLRVFTTAGEYHAAPEWSDNIAHPVEASRGQEGSGDAFSPGWFELPMTKGVSIGLIVTAETNDPAAEELSEFKKRAHALDAACAESQASQPTPNPSKEGNRTPRADG
mgnify:CR=1 FL=1